MFTCFDCKEKRRNSEKSYSYIIEGKWQASCRDCINTLEKWAGFLNAVWNPFNKKYKVKNK